MKWVWQGCTIRVRLAAVQVDEEWEELRGGDDAEYQRFLQSLRDLPDLPLTMEAEGDDSGAGERIVCG